MDDLDGYLRISEIAKDIGVCERTIRDWTKRGLVCYRVSRRLVLIKKSDLDEFLSQFKDDKNIINDLVDEIMQDL